MDYLEDHILAALDTFSWDDIDDFKLESGAFVPHDLLPFAVVPPTHPHNSKDKCVPC